MLNASGVADVIDFAFHPWGNAYYATKHCGAGPYDPDQRHCWFNTCVKSTSPPADCFGTIVAQHGDEEKHVNIIEACAIKHYPKWTIYWPFVQCAEANYESGEQSLGACATKTGLDFAALDSCAAGAEGAEAALVQAKATPDHPGVPYILVNGQPLDNPTQLLRSVCAAYTGEAPHGCKELAVADDTKAEIIV
mmetsp:Transcript_58518/g.125754  ORF Transcript_58518/g.125754 Transcript_58518/m.125754 type:complete len:193 (+) Transcript_58518:184-762(+)